jgi:adenylylsulfate kinase
LVAHGVTVVFDATANRRAYREFARQLIPWFLEIAIDCPLNVCMERDKKGIYHRGVRGESSTVPGLQEPYETPLNPDLLVDSTKTTPEAAADRILAVVRQRMINSAP